MLFPQHCRKTNEHPENLDFGYFFSPALLLYRAGAHIRNLLLGGLNKEFLIGRAQRRNLLLGGSIRNFSLDGSHKDFLIGRLKQGISYLGGSDKEFLIRSPTLGG